MKCEKSRNHTISYQSLLLSTTVLNDYGVFAASNMQGQLHAYKSLLQHSGIARLLGSSKIGTAGSWDTGIPVTTLAMPLLLTLLQYTHSCINTYTYQ